MQETKFTKEQIDQFFAGSDPMERIIKIECGYDDENVSIIYRNEKGEKRVRREPFKPFTWAKVNAARMLYGGNRELIKQKMAEYGIGCKALRVNRDDGTIPERIENGYRLMFYAKGSMSFTKFMRFFKDGGVPIYPKPSDPPEKQKCYIVVAPVEQFMISTGKRMFKDYDDYDDPLRMIYDLETTGLNPEVDMIDQIGIKTNKGFEKIITVEGEGEEKFANELKAIGEFFDIIYEIKPDILTGHNRENFDSNFIDVRLQKHGTSLKSFTDGRFRNGIYKKKKQSVLKLGGEMEYFYPTVMWGHNLTDSLFAVRRAMAVNSNIKSANLKYITKFSKMNKPNRVYVPGKEIGETWSNTREDYIFNDENGHWFHFDDALRRKTFKNDDDEELPRYIEDGETVIDQFTGDKYRFVSGRYIVERYLLDDLWETDKVEYKYNVTNFFLCKMLPISFEKACTMGTAAVWKYIMLTWSYEHGLAIPQLIETKKFTGGLSRLLKAGKIKKQVKLDFNSLYPSIILTFGIRTLVDLQDTMPNLLEYLLTMREHYKDLKKQKGKEIRKINEKIEKCTDKKEREKLIEERIFLQAEEALYDNTQTCIKLICNGFFGSYGSGRPFPHSDIDCAEETTCIGRQSLRLMIHHFSNISTFDGANLGDEYNYVPVVGDSFTWDTPLFIKYNDTGLIDIQPIAALINHAEIKVDGLGREYDYSKKDYKVLCRSGWVEPSYIYRHKTDKPIYRVEEDDMMVDVTKDHSLFNDRGEKITPEEITENTKLEYYKGNIFSDFNTLDKNSKPYETWLFLLNATIDVKKQFIENTYIKDLMHTKTNRARILFIKNCIEKSEKN